MLDIFDYCIKIKNDGKQETNNKLEKININILNEKNNKLILILVQRLFHNLLVIQNYL